MSGSVESLQEPLRSAVKALQEWGPRNGVKVTIWSARRNKAQQISLRKSNCGSSQWAIYEKPASQCNPATARPGTSKHETGRAVDLGPNASENNKQAEFLRHYGVTRTVPTESWHFEFKPGAPDRYLQHQGKGTVLASTNPVAGPQSNSEPILEGTGTPIELSGGGGFGFGNIGMGLGGVGLVGVGVFVWLKLGLKKGIKSL